MKKIELASSVVIFIYWLHLLRNISSLYFLALGGAIVCLVYTIINSRKATHFDRTSVVVFIALCYASLMTIIQQGFYEDPEVGLFRFWATAPLIFVAMTLATVSIRSNMRWFVGFYLVASFTFPFQYITGPISWFAEASERAGSERFASLIGSLTAYGGVVGVAALAALCFFSPPVSFICLLILIIGGALSLQKAAIANIFLALAIGFWVNRGLRISMRSASYIFSAALIVFTLSYFVFLNNGLASMLIAISFRSIDGILSGDTEMSGDVGFFESVIARVTDLPLEAINFHNATALFFGSGVFGGAGALGYPDFPMAHNGLVELVLIFGAPIGVFFGAYLVYFFVSSLRTVSIGSYKTTLEKRFLVAGYGLLFLNNLFAGGGFFQPISASVFWLVFFRLRFLNKQAKPKKNLELFTNKF